MKQVFLSFLFLSLSTFSFGQSIYIPNGTAGLGTSTQANNIGLGTNSPLYRLDLNYTPTVPSVYAPNPSALVRLRGISPNLLFDVVRAHPNDTGAAVDMMDARLTNSKGTVNAIKLGVLAGMNQANLPTFTSFYIGKEFNDPYFRILANKDAVFAGRVGIGTPSSPVARLQIANPNSIALSNIANSSILLGDTTTGLGLDSNEILNRGAELVIGTMTSHGIGIRTNNAERLRIAPNGFVGIGTTTPDAELTVKGMIHAREVKVDLLGPLADYVFENYYNGNSTLNKEYKFLSLNEVEKFTKENKHLPNVPSAQEVKEKGVQVGEMTNILLEKVEELTLYLIEQKKEIERLKSEVNELKSAK